MKTFGDYYIDLGTSNTLIFSKSKGFQINEPTVLAFKLKQNQKHEIKEVGEIAKKMIGKVPIQMSTIRPLKDGVISDFDSTCVLVHKLISRIDSRKFSFRPRLIISLPYHVNKYEKDAIYELGLSLGATNVDLIEEPIAAAIGAGFSVFENKGKMIVDIGGGISEAAVISCGGIVSSEFSKVGGLSLEVSIVKHLRDKFHFMIGEQTAELIKNKVVNLSLTINNRSFSYQVGGLDLRDGLPKRFIVNSQMIIEPVEQFVKEIVSIIRKTYESCPPEIAADLLVEGISITGGCALIRGLQQRLEFETSLKVNICNEPLYSVARGGALLLSDHKLFDKIKAG
jgi:rod shape-determining protein MreB